MANSMMKELGEGIAAALNAQTWTLEAKAIRGWKVIEEREAAKEPTITVVVTTKTTEAVSRAQKAHKFGVEVTVQREHGAGPGETDPVERDDKIAALAQEVENFLSATKIDADGWHATPTRETSCELSNERLDLGIFAMAIDVAYVAIL